MDEQNKLATPDQTVAQNSDLENVSLSLTVSSPQGAAGHMQQSLIDWCQRKIEACRNETKELRDARDKAIERKWAATALKNQAALSLKRQVFYEKVLAALQAGYCIFPTVDCELFAVRTDRENPTYRSQWLRWGSPNWNENAQLLPVAEGEYVNPQPILISIQKDHINEKTLPDGTKKQEQVPGRDWWVDSFDDIEFPLVMAKPQIMDDVGKAMARKIFDEIGIVNNGPRRTATRQAGDPIIVGRIIDPRRPIYGQRRRISFILSWHINTRDL